MEFQVRLLRIALPLAKSWLRANTQATPSNLPFYDIFALAEKVPLSKISDDVIACDLWFAPPPNHKSWLR